MEKSRHVWFITFAVCASLVNSPPLDCAYVIPSEGSQHDLAGPCGYEEHFPMAFNDEYDFGVHGIMGTGTRNDPYVLRDVNITSTTTCLSISGISSYFIVEHCYFRTNPSLRTGHSDMGVVVTLTKNLIIRDCIIVGGMRGITLNGVSDSVLELSTVRDCETAVHCSGSNITIDSNRILDNMAGLTAYSLYNSTIRLNRVYGNNDWGVLLYRDTSGNAIWGNHMGWNGAHDNARDDGQNNTWDDDSSVGNLWADYSGFGEYQVPGIASSVDRFPLTLEDHNAAEITGPCDFIILSQTNDMTVTWIAIDEYPWTCNVTIRLHTADQVHPVAESVSEWTLSPEWDYYSVNVTLPPLSVGEYGMIAEFWDAAGNHVSYNTTVQVQRRVTAEDAILVVMSAGLIACGVLVVETMRKRGRSETPVASPER